MNKLLLGICAIVLLSSALANVLLVRECRDLSKLADSLESQGTTPKGVILPALRGDDLSGTPMTIEVKDTDRPSVLFVFSPACSVCAKNWPKWKSMLDSRKTTLWRPVFVNVGTPSSAEFRTAHGLGQFPTIDIISKDSALAYRFLFTPETIVVNTKGKAEDVWIGELPEGVAEKFPQTISAVH